jgi:hypothetical protein
MCPFAWLTSRWLGEVERLGRIDLTVRIMSLSILNEDRDDASEFYRDLVDRAWGPARLAIAIERDYGADALRRWYDELGRRIHTGGERIDIDLLAETLAATALPDTLLAEAYAGTAADLAGIDALLRESHRYAVDSVGDDVGTPVVHIIDGGRTIAFFGPVVNPAPQGAEAVRLFDGVALVAGTPGFFELKRTRTGPLVFA